MLQCIFKKTLAFKDLLVFQETTEEWLFKLGNCQSPNKKDGGVGGSLEDECIFVYTPVQMAWAPGKGKPRHVYQPRQKKGLATEMSFNFYYECPK